MQPTENEIRVGVKAYQINFRAKPDITDSLHQVISAVARECFEPLSFLIECKELTLFRVEALD